jgi:hypothetical protein
LKELSLRPYHGKIILCESRKELRKVYKKQTKTSYPYADPKDGGRYVRLEGDAAADIVWLVWGSKLAYLSHEFSHVLLQTFNTIGHDPREGDGEPFCYMLSQLILEAE